MVEWVLRRFVPKGVDPSSPGARGRVGMVASVVCIICNVVLCTTKGLIGLLSGSVSIVADSINNLSDASSNIVSLFGFRMASKPADAEHPYGHGRYEYLASLVVAALIMVVGVELIRSSVDKLLNPSPTEFNAAVVAVLVLSISVKLWMARFNSRLGWRISSSTLAATAVDSRNDVITTSAVLAAAVISYFTGFDLDGWAGMGVGVFIVWSGFSLVRDMVSTLLGQAPDPSLVNHIYDKIMSYPGVLGTHDLMVHDYGPGRQFVSAHVEMAAEVDPLESHDVIDNIEEDLREEGLMTILHYDPIVTSDESVARMRRFIADAVTKVHPDLTIHDLRIVPGTTHTNVIFDCVRPQDLEMGDAELRQSISDVVAAEHPQYICKITVDSSYVSAQ